MSKGTDLYIKAKRRIPGGTQLLSKRPEMFLPERWPAYYSKAKGATIWDLDGKAYVDMSLMGVGACVLGYADSDVDAAARAAIERGVMTTLNAPEELELAEELCRLHPWADMVRYARSGGEAVAVAVRIARAAAGKDTVAFCGYHGWHDWYLAANLAREGGLDGHLLPGLEPAGVPRALAGTALPFAYNDRAELDRIVDEVGGDIGAIVMEPLRSSLPERGFLEHVRAVADRIGAVLVFDEVSSGFRTHTGGVHLTLGVTPDVAVFAKAMSNGYPMAAIIGKRAVMDAAQRTFISSTFWTERIGPTAALATIRKHAEANVPAHLDRIGGAVHDGWTAAAQRNGLRLSIHGTRALSHFDFDHGDDSRVMHTVFNDILLDRGFLASKNFYASLSHTDDHVRSYLAAVDEAFHAIAGALESNALGTLLRGPIAHTGFFRLA